MLLPYRHIRYSAIRYYATLLLCRHYYLMLLRHVPLMILRCRFDAAAIRHCHAADIAAAIRRCHFRCHTLPLRRFS